MLSQKYAEMSHALEKKAPEVTSVQFQQLVTEASYLPPPPCLGGFDELNN